MRPKAEEPEFDLLTLSEVREILGLRTNETCARFLREQGIPVFKLSKKVLRIQRRDLLDFIREHRLP